MKITFIGAGKIGGAAARGIAASHVVEPDDITVTARHAKTRRVSVCNALDCLIIHSSRLQALPELAEQMHRVTLYADPRAYAALDGRYPADKLQKAGEDACVYHNAPTSFTDGAQFGLGAEIGISTQKLGARGPMGLEEITSYKWIVTGNGQARK